MNIFKTLRDDHDIQRRLLEKLVETSGDTDKRDSVFEELRNDLMAHADAEEPYFFNHLQTVTKHRARRVMVSQKIMKSMN